MPVSGERGTPGARGAGRRGDARAGCLGAVAAAVARRDVENAHAVARGGGERVVFEKVGILGGDRRGDEDGVRLVEELHAALAARVCLAALVALTCALVLRDLRGSRHSACDLIPVQHTFSRVVNMHPERSIRVFR